MVGTLVLVIRSLIKWKGGSSGMRLIIYNVIQKLLGRTDRHNRSMKPGTIHFQHVYDVVMLITPLVELDGVSMPLLTVHRQTDFVRKHYITTY